MDPLTAIGLAFAIIKAIIAIYAFLKDHPEITQPVRDMFSRAHFTATQIHDEMQAAYPAFVFQGP